MRGFQLQIRMMLRRKMSNLLTVSLLIVTTLFLLLYPGVIEGAKEKMIEAGKGISISGWAYHPKDDVYVSVPITLRDALVDAGFVKTYLARSKVQYFALDEIVEKQGVGDTAEARREYILQKLKVLSFKISAAKGSFLGVNDICADEDLQAMEEQITYLDGYDASCLQGEEFVCLYPAGRGVELGDTVEILLSKPLNGTAYDQDRLLTSFRVVGVFKWASQDPVAYCPLKTIENLVGARADFDYTMNKFTFVVGRNEKISQLKDFLISESLHEGENLRFAIDDRLYEKAMAPLEKNVNLLQGLQYVFYVLVILLGFFLCFLVARRRKPEYAVMRLLGESAAQVVLKSLLEQLILCITGIGIGLVCMLLREGGELPYSVCVVILLSYCLGAVIAVALTVRVDVMTVLRDKE